MGVAGSFAAVVSERWHGRSVLISAHPLADHHQESQNESHYRETPHEFVHFRSSFRAATREFAAPARQSNYFTSINTAPCFGTSAVNLSVNLPRSLFAHKSRTCAAPWTPTPARFTVMEFPHSPRLNRPTA